RRHAGARPPGRSDRAAGYLLERTGAVTRLIARKPLLWMCVLALLVAASATWAAGRASAAGGHAALTPAKVGTAKAHQPARHDSRALTINWALPGTATAGASQDANPPANAIDGNAATSWCTNS